MKFIFFILSFLTVFSSFSQEQKKVSNVSFNTMLTSLLKHSVTEILPRECDTTDDVIYLDAREINEYEVSHIQNAEWIGYETFKLKNANHIPKDKKIIVYCTVGYRSEKVAEKLTNAGYTNVANLYGGIFEWMHSGKLIINDSITKDVHTYNKEWSQWLSNDAGNKIY